MITAEDILNYQKVDMKCVSEDATIKEALEVMLQNKIGAILCKKDDKIVGIWTERDLMRNTLSPDFNPKTARIREYMTTKLYAVSCDDTVYNLMDQFLGLRLRHLLIEKGGEYIGMVSAGDVMKACLHQKTDEIKELNSIVSWEYYEHWKPKD